MRIDETLASLPAARTAATAGTAGESRFGEVLKQYIHELNHEHKQAEKAGLDLALGRSQNTAETLLAIQKADLSFQLMMSVRNKLVDAYHEIMRMQA